jgi:hypothetical protein
MIFIIIFFIVCIVYLYYIIYDNTIKKQIFYSSNEYPQFKNIEDNWMIIKNEIPDFDINKITIKRNKDVWDNQKMEDFSQLLANDPQWFKSWDIY